MRMCDGLSMPFALAIFATEVPNRLAMALSVSPDFTV